MVEIETSHLTMDSTSDLMTLVHALPPELFKQIEKETFNFNKTTTTCKVDSSYKPPNFLQVNQATRKAFAEAFYSSTTFEFGDPEQCMKWLETLSVGHHHLLEKVRFVTSADIFEDGELWQRVKELGAALLSKEVETEPGLFDRAHYVGFVDSPKVRQVVDDLVS